MSKPDYEFPDSVSDDALFEQIKSLHEQYDTKRKRDGEFTRKDYQRINGIGYEKARTELQVAEDAGAVSSRQTGKYIYYKFVEQETDTGV
jgi:hypothetical protein